MKYFFPILKIVAGIAVFMTVLMVSHAVSEKLGSQEGNSEDISKDTVTSDQVVKSTGVSNLVVEGESIDRLANKLRKAGNESEYEPGEKAFAKACELLAGNFFFEAEEKLKELVSKYPYAPSVYEARRILGQRNMDRFLGDQKTGGKKFHKVKSGDSYIKIAKVYDTSLSNMMMLNGLFSFGRLHVGDEILVMPLHFNLVIDIPNRRLTLEYGKKFLKDYPFKKLISTRGKGTRKTIVESVDALTTKGRVRATSNLFRGADKVIRVAYPTLEIVADDFDVDDVFQGVVLERAQMEELASLLRGGNLVEIRY